MKINQQSIDGYRFIYIYSLARVNEEDELRCITIKTWIYQYELNVE